MKNKFNEKVFINEFEVKTRIKSELFEIIWDVIWIKKSVWHLQHLREFVFTVHYLVGVLVFNEMYF